MFKDSNNNKIRRIQIYKPIVYPEINRSLLKWHMKIKSPQKIDQLNRNGNLKNQRFKSLTINLYPFFKIEVEIRTLFSID